MESMKLAEAIVEISGNSSKLRAEFLKSEADGKAWTARMGASFQSLMSIVLPAGIALELLHIGKSSLEAASNIALLSQKLGISATDLTKLEYAGKTVNVSLEDIGRSVGLLSRNLMKGEDEMGKQSHALEKLFGVGGAAKERMKPTIEVLVDIAEKFKNMPDGAAKVATAMELMGRGGKTMIPALNLGRDGFKELGDEAERAGFVMSDADVKAAHELEVKIKKLEMALTGIARTIMTDVLTALDAMADSEKRLASEGTLEHLYGFRDAFQDILRGVIGVRFALKDLAADIKLLGIGAGVLGGAFGPGEGGDALSSAWADYKKRLGQIYEKMRIAFAKFGRHGASGGWGPTDPGGAGSGSDSKGDAAAAKAILQKQLEIATIKNNRAAMESLATQIEHAENAERQANETSKALSDTLERLTAAARHLTLAKKDDAKSSKTFKEEERKQEEALKKFAEYKKQTIAENKTQQTEFEAFMHASELRILHATLSGAAAERQIADENYQHELELAREKFTLGTERYDQAVLQAKRELDAHMRDIDERYANDYIGIMNRLIKEQASSKDQMIEYARQTAAEMERAMGDFFFDAMTGQFRSMQDVVKSFFTSILREISQFLAHETTLKLMKFLKDWYNSKHDSGSSTDAWVSAAGSFAGLFAGGGVFNNGPTAAIIGEAGTEAVVPMPNGAIPVQFTGGGDNRPIDLHLRVALGADLIGAMRTSPDEILQTVNADILTNGELRRTIRARG